jgi:syntaxin-binding protein 1
VRVEKPLKDTQPVAQPLFQRKPSPSQESEEQSLSRFEPNLKLMLEEHIKGTLDTAIFPSTRPQADADALVMQDQSQASLRSAKPTWARTRSTVDQPRQRIIVFVAGGASYAESRACYEVSQTSSKDVILASSHMLTPNLFLRQVKDLSADKRRLDIPAERPKPTAPAHLFETEPPLVPPGSTKPQPSGSAGPPTASLASMSLKSRSDHHQSKTGPSIGDSGGKPPKKEKEKKKHHFFR